MPIIVKIYDSTLNNIVAINIYYNMGLAVKHSKGLISYYDLRRSGNKYLTYKKYYKVEKLSTTNFQFLSKLLSFHNNNNANICDRY